jgi:hypothetical protein
MPRPLQACTGSHRTYLCALLALAAAAVAAVTAGPTLPLAPADIGVTDAPGAAIAAEVTTIPFEGVSCLLLIRSGAHKEQLQQLPWVLYNRSCTSSD